MAPATTQTAPAPSKLVERLTNWLPILGITVWLAGAVLLRYIGESEGWSLSSLLAAELTWFFVLIVAAREAVRNMFGPVFTYEVVRLGRRRLTFILRFLYVAGLMAVLALMFTAWWDDARRYRTTSGYISPKRMAEFAETFFYTFVILQTIVVVLLTPVYVAGAIAVEKERKTLEFLLATDLRNREIVFGKLAARVTNLLMFVLAGLPVIAFLQLFGGIDPEQLLAITTATVVTVIGFSAVGVFFSVKLKKPRDAIALTYMALTAYLIATAFLGGVAMYFHEMYARFPTTFDVLGWRVDAADVTPIVQQVTDWIGGGNAGLLLLRQAQTTRGNIGNPEIAHALFIYTVFWAVATTLLIGYCVARLRVIALAGGEERLTKKGAVKKSAVVARMESKRPEIGEDPIAWKEIFTETGMRGGCVGWIVMLAIGGMVFFWPFMIAYITLIDEPRYSYGGYQSSFMDHWEDFIQGMSVWVRVATGVLGFLAMMGVAVRGASTVSGERDKDTWISLISTPLTVTEMLRGKFLGTVLSPRMIYTVMILVWAIGLAIGAVRPVMIFATVLFFAVYLSAFSWIGIYNSITARNTLIATVRTIMLSLFLIGGFWVFLGFCCAAPLSVMRLGSGDDDFLDDATEVILGWTPPLVLGWMPLNEFQGDNEDYDYTLAPFHWHEYRNRTNGIGPLSPVLGLMIWSGVAIGFATLSWAAFAKATNRARDNFGDRPKRLPPRPPKSERRRRDDDDE